MTKRAITGEEALAILERQREYRREYGQRPEVMAKQREYQREYRRKLAAGYAAAKKAGLI